MGVIDLLPWLGIKKRASSELDQYSLIPGELHTLAFYTKCMTAVGCHMVFEQNPTLIEFFILDDTTDVAITGLLANGFYLLTSLTGN